MTVRPEGTAVTAAPPHGREPAGHVLRGVREPHDPVNRPGSWSGERRGSGLTGGWSLRRPNDGPEPTHCVKQHPCLKPAEHTPHSHGTQTRQPQGPKLANRTSCTPNPTKSGRRHDSGSKRGPGLLVCSCCSCCFVCAVCFVEGVGHRRACRHWCPQVQWWSMRCPGISEQVWVEPSFQSWSVCRPQVLPSAVGQSSQGR